MRGGDGKEKNKDRPPLPLYLSTARPLVPYQCSVIMHLPIKMIHPGQTTARKDISSSSLARLILMVQMPFSTLSQFQHALSTWCSCSGAGVKNTVLWLRTTRTAMEEGSRYLFLVAVCGGKQVDVNVREQTRCKHKAKGRPTGSKSNPKNGRWKRRYTDALCQWRGETKWRSERTLSFQKQDKGIYINSLLYNHDKQQQQKNTFTQKYKFEIINSTSVSDNSFFPPLRKVQSCIVLKAIYESWRRAGRRRKGFVAENHHAVILGENHRAEDQKLRSPLGNSTQGPSVYTWRGRSRGGLDHKVQELDGVGSCVKYWVQVFATRIWQTMCFEGFYVMGTSEENGN